jgi:hypothetical protein
MTAAAPSPALVLMRVLGITLISLLCLAALVGLIMLMTGDDSEEMGKLIGSCVLASGFCGMMLAAAMSLRERPLWALVIITILSGTIAAGAWLLLIWEAVPFFEGGFPQIGGFSTVVMVVCVHAARMACVQTKSKALSIFRWLVVAAFGTFGTAIGVTIIGFEELYRAFGDKGLLVMYGILVTVGSAAVLGTLLVPAIAWTLKRREKLSSESVSQKLRVEMECPRCGAAQSLPAGPAYCGACRFSMLIEIEEPRCQCGYLLYQLKSEACPECGLAIPADKKWGEAALSSPPLG